MGKRIDLTGKQIGALKVLEYLGDKKYLCKCSCGKEVIMTSSGLRKTNNHKCNHESLRDDDITGMHFWDWKVLSYEGDGLWLCQCSCGTVRSISKTALVTGKTKSCGHGKLKDLTGLVFGQLKVIEYAEDGKWKCKCGCGAEVIRTGYDLRSGRAESCGSDTHKISDLVDRKFGRLTVIDYAGNGRWLCRCQCGTEIKVSSAALTHSKITSCGCDKTLNIQKLKAIMQKDSVEIASEMHIEVYGLTHEVYAYIMSIYKGEIKQNCKITDDISVDILIESEKIAIKCIEYSFLSLFQLRNVKQTELIKLNELGFRTIFIFEHEWKNELKQSKIKGILKMALCRDKAKIYYARNLKISKIGSKVANDFCMLYHLNGRAFGKVHIGLYSDNELLGVMILGKVRYESKESGIESWEIYRLAFKADTIIVGGTERMFKWFIREYNPDEIISYCDISKFKGDVYERLGFTKSKQSITYPDYIWWDREHNNLMSRYQTQKYKLVRKGLGDEKQTEDEIMTSLGYIKIYGCGSSKYIWTK